MLLTCAARHPTAPSKSQAARISNVCVQEHAPGRNLGTGSHQTVRQAEVMRQLAVAAAQEQHPAAAQQQRRYHQADQQTRPPAAAAPKTISNHCGRVSCLGTYIFSF